MLPQSVLRNVEPSIHQADAGLFADTFVGLKESASSASSHGSTPHPVGIAYAVPQDQGVTMWVGGQGDV